MRKSLFFYLFSILLYSCNNEEIKDIPVEIILDHPIGDVSIKNNKELYDFLLPFPESTGGDSIILNFISTFKRIDIDPAYVDSLKVDSTWLVKAQVWLGGGRDNPSLFIRNRVSEITDATISTNFLRPVGRQSVIDSFLSKNPYRYIILSADTALVTSYKSSLGNSTIIAFESLVSLKQFLRSSVDSLEKLNQPIRVIFFPSYKYVLKSDTMSVVAVHDNITSMSTEKNIIKQPATPTPSDTKGKNAGVNPCSEEVEPLIQSCLAKPSGEEKLIYFYDRVFRFIKVNPCNSDSYIQLLKQVQPLIANTSPRYNQNGYNAYYTLTCSHLRYLVEEFARLNISYNSSAISQILNQCPN
jgi:hypothetical protein